MKNESKCTLKIKQIAFISLILLFFSADIQFFVFKNQEMKIENNENQRIQIAQIYERDIDILSTRSLEKRKYTNNKSIKEITISKDMDLTQRCGVSKEDFKKLMKNLKNDTSGFFYKNSDIIYDLCKKYELNEIFFCGLIAAEAGWKINENHRNKCNYISIMSKGKLIRYNSEQEGLEAAAKLLHNKYLKEDGTYYNGKTLKDVQKKFCPKSSTWVDFVYGRMEKIIT